MIIDTKIISGKRKKKSFFIECDTCKATKWYNKREAHGGSRKYCSRKCINKNRKHNDKVNKKKGRVGIQNAFYGKTHTKEAKTKISNYFKGKTLEQLYGDIRAKEIKKKLSIASTGNKNGFYGKAHTGKTLQRCIEGGKNAHKIAKENMQAKI